MKRGLMTGAAVVIALCPMLFAACATTGPMTSSRTPDLPGGVIHRGSGTPAAVAGPTGPVETPAASPVLTPQR